MLTKSSIVDAELYGDDRCETSRETDDREVVDGIRKLWSQLVESSDLCSEDCFDVATGDWDSVEQFERWWLMAMAETCKERLAALAAKGVA